MTDAALLAEAQAWINVLNVLESIDEVPGMPVPSETPADMIASVRAKLQWQFVERPARFLRRADAPTRAAIWAEIRRRIGGGK